MNAAEIEEAISELVDAPFDAGAFPYQFLQAFGVSDAAVAKLKAGRDNKSDVPGGVLQRARNNIHLKVCPKGEVAATLKGLHASDATKKLKAKYVLATDGDIIAAERLRDGTPLACAYKDLPNRFGPLLELAGITTTPPIDESTFDIRATNKLNKLYVELLRHNKQWDTAARRSDLNHFFARLIFCLFAEDTGIFEISHLFTDTLEKYTDRAGVNVHEILTEVFRAMDVRREDRATSPLRPFALRFPYVNGNLFSGNIDVPRFTQAARIHLLDLGTNLNWKLVNPDIFGSMIQAVADDEDRGALGMHYTSVPNILKVLNPLFLDDLRRKLNECGDSPIKLLNLRKRLSRIRVFDPACGSGNFLVIAYKEMRKIEAIINERRSEKDLPSTIPMTNFRGIEIRNFAAEIARLALIIAKFQSDYDLISPMFARGQALPLNKENWITCDNALRVNWHDVMKDDIDLARRASERLFDEHVPLTQRAIDFENEGGETYICGNPPYAGATVTAPKGASKEVREKLKKESERRKADLETIFGASISGWKSLDYVSGWFYKFCLYADSCHADAAFVSTNSISQGQQVPLLWPHIFKHGLTISFARNSFKWKNLAAKNAGVTVVVIGLRKRYNGFRILFDEASPSNPIERHVEFIGPYLVPNIDLIVPPERKPINGLPEMDYGSKPADGGGLIVTADEFENLSDKVAKRFIKPYFGSDDYIAGKVRYCVWIEDDRTGEALASNFVSQRAKQVREFRAASDKAQTREMADSPLRFAEIRHAEDSVAPPLVIPIHTAEDRLALPVGALPRGAVVSNAAYGLYDAPLWCMAIIASRIHLVWIATVCGKIKTDYRYSNTLGWNTFPAPSLKEQDKADLTRCAEDILLAREAHFPATIAELYNPEKMPADLRAAHDRNDDTLERIYIGRRFKNDTERLEKLFAMYTEMTGKLGKPTPGKGPRKPRKPKSQDA